MDIKKFKTCFVLQKIIMGDDWNDEAEAAMVEMEPVQTVMAELPEVKLFGKWSCEDVQVTKAWWASCCCLIFEESK